jgi:hypothetical protein
VTAAECANPPATFTFFHLSSGTLSNRRWYSRALAEKELCRCQVYGFAIGEADILYYSQCVVVEVEDGGKVPRV